VTAVEDFYRKRFIYQLTRAGEAVEAALGTYDEVLGRRGELQAVALHDIVRQLRALLVIASDDEPDPAKAHLALSVLTGRFTDLADNARAFMGSLQRTIDLHDIEVEAFLAYKDRLIQYLERFIQDLITIGGRIALLIGELEAHGRVGPLLSLAAAREAADAAPEDSEQAEAAAREKWAARWSGLAEWFVSAEGRESQARLLTGASTGLDPETPGGSKAVERTAVRAFGPFGRLPRAGPLVRGGARRRGEAPVVAGGVRAVLLPAPDGRRRHPRRMDGRP
jgi:uncharacterized protein (TIGR02677 family)